MVVISHRVACRSLNANHVNHQRFYAHGSSGTAACRGAHMYMQHTSFSPLWASGSESSLHPCSHHSLCSIASTQRVWLYTSVRTAFPSPARCSAPTSCCQVGSHAHRAPSSFPRLPKPSDQLLVSLRVASSHPQERATRMSCAQDAPATSVSPPLHLPYPPNSRDLSRWLSRHHSLLSLEITSSDTSSSHSSSELASTGQALLHLTPLAPSVGPGGKSLISFIKNSAFHRSSDLGTAHAFRNGDACSVVLSAASSSQGKTKTGGEREEKVVDAVVFRVERESIVLAVGRAREGNGEQILPSSSTGGKTFDLIKIQDARVIKR